MKPSIGIDTKGLAGILLEFNGALYRLEKSEKAYRYAWLETGLEHVGEC